jgi:hypothetical protein
MAFEIEQPIDLGGQSAVVEPTKPRLLGVLGPGLITGASDHDPSGIATYSQAGAQFGYAHATVQVLNASIFSSFPHPLAITGDFFKGNSWSVGLGSRLFERIRPSISQKKAP